MGTSTVGKVIVAATIQNLEDLYDVKRGLRKPEDVRQVDVTDALVDTGATMLSLPSRMIQQLGLERVRSRRARTAAGLADFEVFSLVRLSIQGRECSLDVAEIPDDCPVLIGQLPLEHMDWVVDPIGQRLIGNPAHGGEQMIELFSLV